MFTSIAYFTKPRFYIVILQHQLVYQKILAEVYPSGAKLWAHRQEIEIYNFGQLHLKVLVVAPNLCHHMKGDIET